ncbi:MAG: SAM-dependent methyltransferase [Micromonosporaceae bacterium]
MSDNPEIAIDVNVPNAARVYDYLLGGVTNFEIDRQIAERNNAVLPGGIDSARAEVRANRAFLVRAVRYLAGEAGIRQFLDIGTGIPTGDHVHNVAQEVAPESRIVYVDYDPIVLAHAHSLLTSTPEGVTAYIDADLHQPEQILESARATLDFDRPIALILSGILGHVGDHDAARDLVRRLMAPMPPGSHLSLNEGADTDSPYAAAQSAYNASGAVPYHLRSPEQIEGFFDGLELVEPGVVTVPQWRPDVPALDGHPQEVGQFGGVGRKP